MKHLTNKWTQVIAIFGILLAFSSCSSEDGIDGTNGTDGIDGIDGIQGEVGPAGADGTIIYSGEGEALAATGITGDYYFDVTTGMLYGPKKIDNSWDNTEAFSLKGTNGDDGDDGQDGINGSDGADGQDGNVILSGTGTPDLSLGSTGDYYLDKESFTLYGPKTQRGILTSWGVGLMLKGADGNANIKTFKLTIASEDWTIGQNTITNEYKWMYYKAEFSAFNQDIYDNGIVLIYWKNGNRKYGLPFVSFTRKKNLLQRSFLLDVTGSTYSIEIRNSLEARNDPTELLTAYIGNYEIKIITGTTAETLSAYKGDDERLFRVAEDMGLLD